MHHLPSIIVVTPLLTGLLIIVAAWVKPRLCFPMAFAALSVSFLSSIGILLQVFIHKIVIYHQGGWPPPIGISYRIDGISAPVLVVITLVALINLIPARTSVKRDFPDKANSFYSLYVLFITGLIGIVETGDAFNLYVLLEIASLTGYSLIGMGRGRAALSALNYVFMGTIGASFYLLGVGYLYLATGTLNMQDISQHIASLNNSSIVLFAFIFCLVGVFIKMAFFPLHGWLPNAYSFTPSASSGVIAALTTKVMLYVMIRISLSVFGPIYIFSVLSIHNILVWFAIATIIIGSFLALMQKSLKRMLSYIIIVEVAYMVGGFWLGNRTAMSGSILHIINDAMMTFCIFLAVAVITYKRGSDAFENLQGLFQKMPFTMFAFVIGAFSIIGIPPTCGFFSKWYLLSGAIEAHQYYFVAALIFSSLVNVVLFFRLFEIFYFEPFAEIGKEHTHAATSVFNEAPLSMVLPLLVTAVLLLVLGFYAGDIVTNFIQTAIPQQIFL